MDTLQSVHMECDITLENHAIEQFKIRSIVMHHSGQLNTKFPCRSFLQLCDNSVIKKKTKIQTIVLHLKNVVLRNLWTCHWDLHVCSQSLLFSLCFVFSSDLWVVFFGFLWFSSAFY